MAYAPTEDEDDDRKDEFYEKLQNVVEGISKHDILVVLGDMNAKVGRETDIFGKAIGRHSLHQECNENGLRLCSFAEADNIVIDGTIFPHKRIHKESWIPLDGVTRNQIDHIMVNQRFRSALQDVRSFRGADCDYHLL